MAQGKRLGMIEVITKFFTLWVVVFAVLAILFPGTFKKLAPYIPYLLMAVMFGMGMTLTAVILAKSSSGSILANYWGQRPTRDGSGNKFKTAAAD